MLGRSRSLKGQGRSSPRENPVESGIEKLPGVRVRLVHARKKGGKLRMSLTCGPRVAVRGTEGEGTDARARLVSEGGERGSGARGWAVGLKQAGPRGENGPGGKGGGNWAAASGLAELGLLFFFLFVFFLF